MDLLCPVLTKSGWVYSVISLYNVRGSFFGNPMYYPDESGERIFRGRRYSKYKRQTSSCFHPQQSYPGCVQMDPWSVLVPTEQIIEYADTKSALNTWLKGNDLRTHIVQEILDTAGIKMEHCGLGGSFGIGCGTHDSDIDILIYGNNLVSPCLNAIMETLLNNTIELMSHDTTLSYAKRYSGLYGLNQDYLYEIFANDLTKVYYQGQKISFIFSYRSCECNKIPSTLYAEKKNYKEMKIIGRIIDKTDSWLYPRKHVVETFSGNQYQVWSHHWLRDPVTPVGTRVEVVGLDLGGGVISLTELHHHIVPYARSLTP